MLHRDPDSKKRWNKKFHVGLRAAKRKDLEKKSLASDASDASDANVGTKASLLKTTVRVRSTCSPSVEFNSAQFLGAERASCVALLRRCEENARQNTIAGSD